MFRESWEDRLSSSRPAPHQLGSGRHQPLTIGNFLGTETVVDIVHPDVLSGRYCQRHRSDEPGTYPDAPIFLSPSHTGVVLITG